ncbi:hypothetical protein HMI54_004382, partial [Coelomomyces lativittatus]
MTAHSNSIKKNKGDPTTDLEKKHELDHDDPITSNNNDSSTISNEEKLQIAIPIVDTQEMTPLKTNVHSPTLKVTSSLVVDSTHHPSSPSSNHTWMLIPSSTLPNLPSSTLERLSSFPPSSPSTCKVDETKQTISIPNLMHSPNKVSPLLRQIQTPSPFFSSSSSSSSTSPPFLSLKLTPSTTTTTPAEYYASSTNFIPCTTPTSIHSPTSLSFSPRNPLSGLTAATNHPCVFDALETQASLRGHVQHQLTEDLKPLKRQFDTEVQVLLATWHAHFALPRSLDPSSPCGPPWTTLSSGMEKTVVNDEIVDALVRAFPLDPEEEVTWVALEEGLRKQLL